MRVCVRKRIRIRHGVRVISINKKLATLRVLYILVAFLLYPLIDNVLYLSLSLSVPACLCRSPLIERRRERESGISFVLELYVILI